MHYWVSMRCFYHVSSRLESTFFSEKNVLVVQVTPWGGDVYFYAYVESDTVRIGEELYNQLAKADFASEIKELDPDVHCAVEGFELKIAA